MSTNAGYFRLPTICRNTLSFVSEDDLWLVDLDNNNHQPIAPARRLSANPGIPTSPAISPDGKKIAFLSRDEGMPEIYLIPTVGGSAQRRTFLGSNLRLLGWHPHKKNTLHFCSDSASPFLGQYNLYEIPSTGGEPKPLKLGPAFAIAHQPTGPGTLILRHGGGRRSADPALWKRYRGGTAGQLWIDHAGKGNYKRILENLNSDLAAPLWIGKRIYFLSDHQGIANIYSCTVTGKNLQRHTHHEKYYVRHPQTDGRTITYTAGAEIHLLDPRTDTVTRLKIQTPSTFQQRNRKFVNAAADLESYHPHPKGHSLCLTTRGKPVTLAHWEGPVTQLGQTDCSERYRLAQYLPDGETVVALTDRKDHEQVVFLRPHRAPKVVAGSFNLGRTITLKPAPDRSLRLALTNHRHELIIIDGSGKTKPRIIEKSNWDRINDLAWSPDARWLVYSFADSESTTGLRILNLASGKITDLTTFDFNDTAPAFDPAGNYLYFISYREYDPVYDTHFFDLGFPRGMRLLAIPLRRTLPSPFEPLPRAPGAPLPPLTTPRKNENKSTPVPPVKIDLRGIRQRLVAMPIPEGRYAAVRAIPGKILFSSFPIEGALNAGWPDSATLEAKGVLESWDLSEQKRETLVTGISSFELSADHKTLIYRAGNRLRALKAGTKPPTAANGNAPSRASGWIDLNRIKLTIHPPNEWCQMFNETWRLQRDQYYLENMGGTDWNEVRARYAPLLKKVSCRSEFSDLLWELQGELGTSHTYEIGGDYRPTPAVRQGFLGADFKYDPKAKTWRIKNIPQGDSWQPKATSPLAAPGVNLKINDRLLAINQQKLTRSRIPAEFLVNLGGQPVRLTVADAAGRNKRDVTVCASPSETQLRYRDWVENNRAYVQQKSRGKIGYIHIPDMGPNGYSQFHRYFHAELKMTSLIVDVRFNGGGHVSQLILEKLLRKRIGYDLQRHGNPVPYPTDSVLGPIVALTNQNAGSDGDIFSHCFKLANIGTLIGTRTWGGVVGIWPRHALVDGTITTQPEFAFWFEDVGFGVENYGTEPDLKIEITPQDYAAGRDPQLERAIKEIQTRNQKKPPQLPNFGPFPKLGLPKLPPK